MSENKKFRLFGEPKEKPDLLAEDTTPTLTYFFKQLWRKAGKLLTLNLMMSVLYLPLVAVVLIYLFGQQSTTMSNAAFAPLLGISLSGGTPAATALLGIFGGQGEVANPTTGAIVVMIVLIAITALTWGWQNVGGYYNLRSLVRGDSCFLWSDYFYAIKRNLRQGFVFGLIDFALIALLIFDWFYLSSIASLSFFYGVMYFAIIAIAILYVFMRFYIYPMMITFDLSIKKLIKNAFIFSMLGIKRNIMALLGMVLVLGVNLALIGPALSIGFTLPIILPFFYFPALSGFMSTYAAYPNIKRYMIDGSPNLDPPFYSDDEPEEEAETDVTPPPQEEC